MLISETKLRSIVRSEIARSESGVDHRDRRIVEIRDEDLTAKADWQAKPAAERQRIMATGAGIPSDDTSTFTIDSRGVPVMNRAVAAEMERWFAPVDDSVLFSAASIFDPTGFMSWPQFYRAWARYSQNSSAVNAILMILSLLGCVPLMGSAFKATKFATTFIKSQKILSTATDLTNLGKLKAIGKAFSETSAKWVELVDSLTPASDEIARVIKQAVPESTITGKALVEQTRRAAEVVDGYSKHIKHISHVVDNAKGEVQQFLLGRFAPDATKTVDVATARAAAPISKAAGQLPTVVANTPQLVTRAVAQVIPPEWQAYIARSSKWGASSQQSASAIVDYFTKKGQTYQQFVTWYNQTRNNAKVMATLGKQAGQHITFEEIRKLLKI